MLKSLFLFLLSILLLNGDYSPNEEYAEIHIFRPKQFQGGVVNFQVLAGTQKLTSLGNGSRTILKIYHEGAIDLKLKASVFSSKTVSLGVVKGEKYFIKAGYNDGFGSKLSFIPLTQTEGQKLFEDRSQYHRPKIKIIDDAENRFRTLNSDDIYTEALKTIEKKEGAKPGLVWLSPQRNNQKTEIEVFTIQLCITSEAENFNLSIKHNGQVFDEIDNISASKKACAYTYISNVKLVKGTNEIDVSIQDEFGTSEYKRTIQYKPKDVVTKRGLALVLGNSNYTYVENLPNPANDARDMERALERLDFEVMKFKDLGYEEMKKAVGNYLLKLQDYQTGIVFYAGHGIQHEGRNYLLPVDVNLANPADVVNKGIDTGDIITKMDLMEVETSVIILDACRNNPFKNLTTKITDSTNGLTGTDAPPGTIVCFATAPGKTASDGIGKNGLYTQEILKHIYKPGLKIEDLFKQVRVSVMSASLNKQIPWETSSLVKDFYFYEYPN